MRHSAQDTEPIRLPQPGRGGPLLAILMILLLVLLVPAAAGADMPNPPPPDAPSLCDPDQEEGDECRTDDGEDGTCIEDEDSCYSPAANETVTCHLCEEDCSVAAVGSRAPFSSVGFGMMLVLGLAWLRRRP